MILYVRDFMILEHTCCSSLLLFYNLLLVGFIFNGSIFLTMCRRLQRCISVYISMSLSQPKGCKMVVVNK